MHRRVTLSRILKVTNAKFIVCDLIREYAACRRSFAFVNVGLGRLTGSQHAISILDLREA